MSLIKNLLSNFVPVRESRNFAPPGAVPLNVNGAELVCDVDGDEHALINIQGTSPVMTITFEGSVDGVNYFAVPVQLLAGVGGTVPNVALAMISDVLAATNTLRVYAVRVGQLRKFRVRITAYTSGAIDVVVRADVNRSIHPGVNDRVSSPLLVTTTAAVGVAASLSLPLVTGLRHYIDFIKVRRSATAALTPSATPVLVTTTNLPGSPVFTFGSDAAGVGIDQEQTLDFGGAGLAAAAPGVATTVVAPAYAGVIWRITASYRLGL